MLFNYARTGFSGNTIPVPVSEAVLPTGSKWQRQPEGEMFLSSAHNLCPMMLLTQIRRLQLCVVHRMLSVQLYFCWLLAEAERGLTASLNQTGQPGSAARGWPGGQLAASHEDNSCASLASRGQKHGRESILRASVAGLICYPMEGEYYGGALKATFVVGAGDVIPIQAAIFTKLALTKLAH